MDKKVRNLPQQKRLGSGVEIAIALLVLAGLQTECRLPLPAPGPVALRSPCADSVLHRADVTLVWDTVSQAAGYQVQVDDKTTFKTPVLDTVVCGQSTLGAFLADGSYSWRVRVLSIESVWGEWSEVRRFKIVTYLVKGSVATRGYPQDIDVRGDSAYVAEGQAGLGIYLVSHLADPIRVGTIMDTLNNAYGVAVAGHYAYLAYGRKQIQIVDLDSLRFLGSVGYTTGYAYDIEALDTTTAVVANHGRFSVFDVSDPNFPILLFEPHAPARAVAMRDTVAFLACEQLGLMIASISTQNPPLIWSILKTTGNARDVAVQGQYAYIADGRAGLTVVDVSDLQNPVAISSLRPPGGGYGNKVSVLGTRAFLANGAGGLAVVDITDPVRPKLTSILPMHEAKAVSASERGVFVGDRDLGLLTVVPADQGGW